MTKRATAAPRRPASPAAGLPRTFYAADALTVARRLLGKILHFDGAAGPLAGRIVEVEAYRGPDDRAAHSSGGRRTPRNEVMWGPPGYAYVYFIYGMHWCANVVTAPLGAPEAVLLRAVEPLAGIEVMRRQRGTRSPDAHLARGPANLCKAFGLDGTMNGADLVDGPLRILPADDLADDAICATPRIGVDYAGDHAAHPWRLYVAGSAAVSGPAALRRPPVQER